MTIAKAVRAIRTELRRRARKLNRSKRWYQTQCKRAGVTP